MARALSQQSDFVWLDSRQDERATNAFSVLAWNATRKVAFAASDAERFMDFLKSFSITKQHSDCDFCFQGGWIGYVTYEALQYFHPQISLQHDTNELRAAFAYYESFIHIDHQKQNTFFVSLKDSAAAQHDLRVLQELLQNPKNPGAYKMAAAPQTLVSPERYAADFAKIQNALHCGTFYELNYTLKYTAEFFGDAFALYLRLRATTPAPMMAFLDFSAFSSQLKILSASPELFFKIANTIITTKPIKGTIQRGHDPVSDAALKNKLCACEKSQAELLMVTDMLRNDVGRFCETGSIRVAPLAAVESFSHYHHLVSGISGTLLPHISLADVFQNMFPGGSITGAPKVKVMQEIARLEDRARGVYTGAIGFISNHGFVEFNIPIRTMTIVNNILEFSVGGGIVADSSCADEFDECRVKAAGILAALNSPSLGFQPPSPRFRGEGRGEG